MNTCRPSSLCVWALCLASLAAPAHAQADKSDKQARPDFTGAWLRESVTRDTVAPSVMGLPRGPVIPETEVKLFVRHRDPELAFRRAAVVRGRERQEDRVHYTDGRGETHRSGAPEAVAERGPEASMKSKTKWDGKRIRIEARLTMQGPAGGFVRQVIRQEWSLSDDGKTLTRKILVMPDEGPDKAVIEGRFGKQYPAETKEVYRRIVQ